METIMAIECVIFNQIEEIKLSINKVKGSKKKISDMSKLT